MTAPKGRHIVLLCALLALFAAGLVSFGAQPASAAVTQNVNVGMPFDGRWARSVSGANDCTNYGAHPSCHPLYQPGANWSTDVYAVEPTQVRANFSGANGALTLRIEYVGSVTGCTAGKVIRVRVKVDGVDVGWVQYVHVNSAFSNGYVGDISNGTLLGTTKWWSNQSCYQVSSSTGVHVHMEAGNSAAAAKACYAGLSSGTTYSASTAIGGMGNTGTSTNQSQCTAGPPPGPSWPGVGNGIFFGSYRLQSGQQLTTNQYLLSPNGQFALHLQTDGNLVLYQGNYIWQTNTPGTGANRLVMQSDGNLVLYNASTWVWQSYSGGTGPSHLDVQDDGNLVVYRNDTGAYTYQSNTGGHMVYSAFGAGTLTSAQSLTTNQYLTSADKRYTLLLQGDGNLVLYGPGYHVLWHAGTGGTGANRLVMQSDGNLVLYNASSWVWQSYSGGAGPSHLDVQDDGNLVVYRNDTGAYTYQSNTGGRI